MSHGEGERKLRASGLLLRILSTVWPFFSGFQPFPLHFVYYEPKVYLDSLVALDETE